VERFTPWFGSAQQEFCARLERWSESVDDAFPEERSPAPGEQAISEAIWTNNNVITNFEAVILLASAKNTLLPSAMVCARACMEAAVNVMYLAQAPDQSERNRRYISLVATELFEYQQLAAREPQHAELYDGLLDEIQNHLGSESDDLKIDSSSVERRIRFHRMLTTVGATDLYGEYLILSSFVHNSYSSNSLWRGAVVSSPLHGSLNTGWAIPFRVIIWSFLSSNLALMEMYGMDSDKLIDPDEYEELLKLSQIVWGSRNS